LGGMNASLSCQYDRKIKEVLKNGRLQPGTELVLQMHPPSLGGEWAVGKMGGPEYRSLLRRYQESSDEADRDLATEVKTLIGLASHNDNDMVAITCSLKERIREIINNMLDEAEELRYGRAESISTAHRLKRAQQLEKKARDLLDDPSSFTIAKMRL